MPRFFIHYVPRRVVTRIPSVNSENAKKRNQVKLWYTSPEELALEREQESDEGFSRPIFHTTKSLLGAAANIEPGSVIWLIAQLQTPWGSLCPALDARIVVETISEASFCDVNEGIKQKRIFRARAEGSSWYPLKDIGPTLEGLFSLGSNKPLISKHGDHVGLYLQSLRELEPGSGEQLEQWAKALNSVPFGFLSYRQLDGNKEAFYAAQKLMLEGRTVFWDRWSLPRRLAERREMVSNAKLNEHLMDKLERAAVVWGVKSPNYALPGSYSEREMQRAIALNKFEWVNAIRRASYAPEV